GEILRQAHQGVIDRLVAVGMVLTDYVADDAGAFLVAGIGIELEQPHGEEHAALHRLEAVARVGQRPRGDGAHRIGQVALGQRVGQRNVADVFGNVFGRQMLAHDALSTEFGRAVLRTSSRSRYRDAGTGACSWANSRFSRKWPVSSRPARTSAIGSLWAMPRPGTRKPGSPSSRSA